ncbi:hypothetical protein OJAV_G00192670 [Oryzias javanicus]|uniref:PR domain zinc finger protein 1 n=1 Tax=Oryzias javanicus TaxID=123683 RepID=A0A437CC88_ORYJA|nr:hypothetical protein OJAV_G00192670 [Oryzias javanicus]
MIPLHQRRRVMLFVVLMSERATHVEWVETTEEVVEAAECVPLKNNSPTVALEATQTSIQELLNSVGQEESSRGHDGFCCEECLALFQSNPDNINGPSFILDFQTSMGVQQRSLLTLPYGLMIGRSSIPGAGIGVINHGPAVSPGMHFGPYEGEVTTKENAITSAFSWEIYKEEDDYEYIDAANDFYSNWMRYITFARSKEETNLLAVQYNGSILYHCCRTIHTGDELTVWPSNKLLSHFSKAWTQMWLSKLNAAVAENDTSATSTNFPCSDCHLSFTTEAFLQRHTENFHCQPKVIEAAEAVDSAHFTESVTIITVDSVKSNTCEDCGKVFKQIPHLKRHKLSVHSNKRPYCCPHCRRSFSQASGLIRHQLVHRKQTAGKAPNGDGDVCESSSPTADESEKMTDDVAAEGLQKDVEVPDAEVPDVEVPDATDEADPGRFACSDCTSDFTNEEDLKKHRAGAHEKLRPYVCGVCQKCFVQYHDLNRHLLCHRKKKDKAKLRPKSPSTMPFSCAKCLTGFDSVDALQQHVNELHSGEEDVTLPAEPVQHPRPQRLTARSKVSAVTKLVAPKRKAADKSSEVDGATKAKLQRWFSCNHCKQTYDKPDDLKAHKCSLKPLKCGQCGATFLKTGFLRRHELVAHVKVKSYSCERCSRDFSTPGKLKQHQKNNSCLKYHCASEHYPCSYCQFSFTMKSYLNKHIKRHHPVEFLSLSEQGSPIDQSEEKEQAHVCTRGR